MKRKALFVGVNEYRDPMIQDLRYAVGDAALEMGRNQQGGR